MNWKTTAQGILERIYRRKLIQGIRILQAATLEELGRPAFVANVIRQIGLRFDRRSIYKGDNRHMNGFGPGLWQIPDQLAGALIFLSQHPIQSALEIGTCDGWTVSVMAAYLRRFHPSLYFTTTDLAGRFTAHADVCRLLPIEYHSSRPAEEFAGTKFDLVFIDGDHSYNSVARDYQLLGKQAAICMFHDIDDCNVGYENVPKFWRELKANEAGKSEFQEFIGPEGVMGIGLRVRKS